MTIKIVDGKIETTLYEKPLALHLYIPPHSCHPPGVLTGLIMGGVLRIFNLCSRKEDIKIKLKLFFGRLLDRGYQAAKITPIFNKAIANAKRYLSQTDAMRRQIKEAGAKAARRRVYFHLPYHPDNPSSAKIQELWRKHIFRPAGGKPLNRLKSPTTGNLIPIDRLIIANSRAPNLGNLLSYRKICKRSGPKVSSYL